MLLYYRGDFGLRDENYDEDFDDDGRALSKQEVEDRFTEEGGKVFQPAPG